MDWKQVLPFYVVELDRVIRKFIEERQAVNSLQHFEDCTDWTGFSKEAKDNMDDAFYLMSVLDPDDMYRDYYTSPRRVVCCALRSFRESSFHLLETLLFKIRNAVAFDQKLEDFLYEITLDRLESIFADCGANQSPTSDNGLGRALGFEFDDVPAQNSPRHILNVLNDDCTAEIFRRLDSFVDYHNVTKVCRKFRDVATTCFPYKTFRIGEYEEDRLVPSYPPRPISVLNESLLKQLKEFLHDFGHRINSIEWVAATLHVYDEVSTIFPLIANLCGKMLLNLKVIGPAPIFLNRHPLSQFEMLQTLELYHVLFGCFVPLKLPKLKCLKLGGMRDGYCSWLSQPFAVLEEVHLLYNIIDEDDIHERVLFEFLALNPQLKILVVKHRSNEYLYPTNEISLRNCSPNLLSLSLKNVQIDLDTLRGSKLKLLHVPSMNFTKAELNSLIATNLPIEELEITPTSVDFVEDMSRLSNLKKLSIRITKVSQRDAVNIIRKLPALEELIVSSGKLSLSKVKEIIQHSSRIVGVLTLRLEWINIDSEEYLSILTLAKGLGIIVKLYVDRWTGRIDVKENKLQPDCMWLDIQSKFIIP